MGAAKEGNMKQSVVSVEKAKGSARDVFMLPKV
jgi:hypothetical protein